MREVNRPHGAGLPAVESEYALTMRRAEPARVRRLVEDIDTGAQQWPEEVLTDHEQRKSQPHR